MFCDGTTNGECVCESGYHMNQNTGLYVKGSAFYYHIHLRVKKVLLVANQP